MPPVYLPLEVFWAFLTDRRPWGRTRTLWRDYISHLPWERLRIVQENLEDVGRVTSGPPCWPACVVLHLGVIFSFFLSLSNKNEKAPAHFTGGIFTHLKQLRFRRLKYFKLINAGSFLIFLQVVLSSNTIVMFKCAETFSIFEMRRKVKTDLKTEVVTKVYSGNNISVQFKGIMNIIYQWRHAYVVDQSHSLLNKLSLLKSVNALISKSP